MSRGREEEQAAPDRLMAEIADYTARAEAGNAHAYALAHDCLFDALACAFRALAVPDCMPRLGPLVPGTIVPDGSKVPGTRFQLDPVKAAFDIGCLIRWLDFSDTWWSGGHPSDNIGTILAIADHLSRRRARTGGAPLHMRDVLAAMIKAYEIHGLLSEGNSFDRRGIDSVILVRIASTAVATQLLGGGVEQIINALSNAFLDGRGLDLYRKSPHAGPRKSWAAADAASRAVRHALMAVAGERGYPTALSARRLGFDDAFNDGQPLVLPRPLGTHVIENIKFKAAYPAQRDAQTAAECAVALHPLVRGRIADISQIVITSHRKAIDAISVTGPLATPAARDHCLQYIVAVGLLRGDVTPESYDDAVAADPAIDTLREKMTVEERGDYTAAFHDPARRANPTAIEVRFRDGSATPTMARDYMLGDPRRRDESRPHLRIKFAASLGRCPAAARATLMELLDAPARLAALRVDHFIDLIADGWSEP